MTKLSGETFSTMRTRTTYTVQCTKIMLVHVYIVQLLELIFLVSGTMQE